MERVRQLYELSGGAAQLFKMPLLHPYETPYPAPPKSGRAIVTLSESEKQEISEGAQLLLLAGQRLTEKFGLSPWSIYQLLLQHSREHDVSFLALTNRLVASLS